MATFSRPTVAGLAVMHGHVWPQLLAHCHPNSLHDGEYKLTTVGGGIKFDIGESPQEALARELYEEYGVDVAAYRQIKMHDLELQFLASNRKRYNWFLVSLPTDVQFSHDPREVLEVGRYSGESGLRSLLACMTDDKRHMYVQALRRATERVMPELSCYVRYVMKAA